MKTKILLLMLFWTGLALAQVRDSLNAKFINPEMEQNKVISSNILRVEGDISTFWRGVRGCADSPTPRRNIEKAANDWVKNKMFEYKKLKWIRYGWGIPVISIRRWKDPFPDKKNHCSGTAKFKIYIEFENQ